MGDVFMKLMKFKQIIAICLSVVFVLSLDVYRCRVFAGSNDILTNNSNNVNTKNQLTFIIDAGHGGLDGGASGLEGTLEKDLNLKIATLINHLLSVMGYDSVMTRDKDVMLGDGEKGSAKMADLKYRLETAQKYENGVFISIHMNKFPIESCRGMTLYYSPNNAKSQEIAEKIRDNNVKYLQKDNTREMKKADSAIYILNRIQIPAVLVECGFVSNPEEAVLLMNEDYQKKLAMVIVCSVISACSTH